MNWNQFKNLSRVKDLPAHEQARQFWVYESTVNSTSTSSAGAGSGGFNINWEAFYNTAFIYTEANLQTAIETTSVSYRNEDNRFIFTSLEDVVSFYIDVVSASLESQPIGNQGYSMGVGTRLRGSRNEIFLDLEDGTRIIVWQLMTQLTSQEDNAPDWRGNSPKGTVGYGSVYCDWDADGVADQPSDSIPDPYCDQIRFKRI